MLPHSIALSYRTIYPPIPTLKFLAAALLGMFTLVCQPAVNAQTSSESRDLPGIMVRTIAQFQDSTQRSFSTGEPVYQPELIKDFYVQRGYAPVWLVGRYVPARASEFAGCLKSISHANGLNSTHYHRHAIDEQLMLAAENKETTPLETLITLELLLTDAYLQLGTHLQSGAVNPKKLDIAWKPMRTALNIPLYLLQTLQSNANLCESLQALEPQQPEYKQLKQLLNNFEQQPEWGKLTAKWNLLLQKGDYSPLVIDLRKRLQLSGELSPDAPMTDYFDKELETAVMLFQRRHGLYYDGLVRSNVMNELNVSPQHRLAQIKANLERWRWAPDTWGSTYVLVNLPDYRLTMFENGQKTYSELIIVGRENYPTPIFADTITYLVFNPYWYMPASIAKNELMKEVDYDTNYFINNDIKVFKGNKSINPATVNWQKVDLSQYYFRQGASAFNPMGLVKFMFPNAYDIYIHDTPSKDLFNNSRRSYSHGCVRVNNPLGLASHLLQFDPTWNEKRIADVIHSQKETTVKLKTPIPIYLVYYSAFIDPETNEVNFREDLYSWDKKIAELLDQNPIKE